LTKIFIACRFSPGLVGLELNVGVEPEVRIVGVEPEVEIKFEMRGGAVICVVLITTPGLDLRNLFYFLRWRNFLKPKAL